MFPTADESQHNVGFLTQSAFTGLAQCLALGTPALLVGMFGMNKDAIGGNNIPDTVYVVFSRCCAIAIDDFMVGNPRTRICH